MVSFIIFEVNIVVEQ